MGKNASFKAIRKKADLMPGNKDRHYKNMKKIYLAVGVTGVVEYCYEVSQYILMHKEKPHEPIQTTGPDGPHTTG
jgi:hypothetical protein